MPRNPRHRPDPLPVTFAGRSEASREYRNIKRKQYQASNTDQVCSVSGCGRARHSLSTYCHTHSVRYRRYGRPVGDLPTQGELRALEGAVRAWLTDDLLTTDIERNSFKINWSSAQRSIRNHPSFAVPFFRLEGVSGYTRQAKGWVILSHYFHRQNNSLSDAMLRYMAVRLWAEFKWQMPNGKTGFKKERNFFVDTWSGYFVLRNSDFSKTTTEEKVIGWEKPWYISDDPRQNIPKRITERVEKKVTLQDYKAGPIVRAIGTELRTTVERALGNQWISDHRLLQKASEALGHTHH